MSNNKQVNLISIGFTTALTLIFITLKLLGKIAWSWLWVLSPTWIPWALFILGAIVYASIMWKHDD